ncbi:MAG TPA: hypothetical protein VMF59_00805 [Bacteroidota bacterium]|nr:hypothetical protein [Bacteroidota bacterium]
MSPHIEYWGIPSPAEELFTFSLAGDGTGNGESMLIGGRRMFVLNIECDEEEADFIPESFE